MSLSQLIAQAFPDLPQAANSPLPANSLRKEFHYLQGLYQAQPSPVQQFLTIQGGLLADAILKRAAQARFRLPVRVYLQGEALEMPLEFRELRAGSWLSWRPQTFLLRAVSQRLAELEGSPNRVVSAGSALVRFAVVHYMVHRLLPAGCAVKYEIAEGEEIPSVPEAQQFYLPQWVAFDQADQLVVQKVSEAEACLASMQHFLAVLHTAVAFAPFIVADEEYQRKRYGMLGQLANQGRALARYATGIVIQTIRQRAAANNLNRGLWLSLPFFDDQALEMKRYIFKVIPPGRIWFVPAFLVQAARLEQVKAAQDTRLSPSTRKHLLVNLRLLEQNFSELLR